MARVGSINQLAHIVVGVDVGLKLLWGLRFVAWERDVLNVMMGLCITVERCQSLILVKPVSGHWTAAVQEASNSTRVYSPYIAVAYALHKGTQLGSL